jgi:hypothetical protein
LGIQSRFELINQRVSKSSYTSAMIKDISPNADVTL